MKYRLFKALAHIASKDDYNMLMEKIFEASVARLRRKKKIKVGFVMIEAAQWCGDDLYNYFAHNKRFEPTVFLSMDFHKDINELVKADFARGVEQLKSHGLNVVPIDDKEASVPEQNLLIFLTPYIQWLPKAFTPKNIPIKTLIAHIPYAFDSARHFNSFYSQPIFLVAWKIFFSSVIGFDIYKKLSVVGVPRGVYAGYPRMDVFFKKDMTFHFDWKMTRPDAKKIIWAPHWSIKGMSVRPAIIYATFQWNCHFMYEFAKAHPEISWVVKPHPLLFDAAVREQVFPTVEAFKEYWDKWNALPNAQVYTGGFYQQIFATSDGMIHDCGSFTTEYQYMQKPMIYLRRDTQKFNELGKEILKVSYCVDGKDLESIAALMKKVFIEGNDYKAAARREVYDKYLNYPKANGMLASEFIYRSIADELHF